VRGLVRVGTLDEQPPSRVPAYLGASQLIRGVRPTEGAATGEGVRMEVRERQPWEVANRAIRFRDTGKYRRAFHWWRSAAALGNGDAWVDVGYCLEHGIGVRRDRSRALRAYRSAIQSRWVTAWCWEEAQYRCGVLLLSKGPRTQRQALQHLRSAAADGDYQAAAGLLSLVSRRQELLWCNCRRGRGRSIRGQARCILHPARNRHRGVAP
jgi:TPR repeat protein